jgi:hypothetical protein
MSAEAAQLLERVRAGLVLGLRGGRGLFLTRQLMTWPPVANSFAEGRLTGK